ncbi:uncharacterized protein METZ01_LOCUS404407 [marine metagenome]|uniref:DNA repair helicase n=1 Tax=marine metagenome TaxID=408172 RepID=A0A382VYH8_9ZZZZ
MELRNLKLKEQYRSDRDDIISEFLIPCLNNCIQYDRTVEFVTLRGLTTLSLGFHNSTPNARIRIITGHQFDISDLDMMEKLFSRNSNRLNFNPEIIRDLKLEQIRRLVLDGNLIFKIAIPSSEEVNGSFSEKMGIFRDANGDTVAFSGTSSIMLARQSKNFESIDVFTSWNDKSRVETKIDDFEKLWTNETNSVKVFDFDYADKHNLLKYSSDWAISL